MMSSLLQRLLTLPRTLEIFLGTITEGKKVRTLLNLEILGGMVPLKIITLKKTKEKVGQPSNNSMDPQCFGCQGYDHMKSECPIHLRLMSKAMTVTLSDDEVLMMSLVVTRMETSLLSLLLL